MFDDFQRRHRSHCQILKFSLNGMYRLIRHKGFRNALPDQQKSADNGKRDQNSGRNADHIFIKISKIFSFSRKTPAERHTCRITGSRGSEHHEDDNQHLAQIRKTRFTGIVLKVCIRHETDDRIKGKRRFHAFDSVRVIKQNSLKSQYEISDKHHNRVRHQKMQCILFPVHSLAADPAYFIDGIVHMVKYRIRKCFLICCDVIHVSTHRYDQHHINRQCDKYL